MNSRIPYNLLAKPHLHDFTQNHIVMACTVPSLTTTWGD